MSYLSVICLLCKSMPLSQLRRRALAPHCSVGLFTDKGTPMFNLTDLLDQLGAHFSLVVIACIELLAAALLVACAVRSEDNRPVGGRRSAVGKAGENGAEMLRALNFRRFEANLLLRRATSLCTREAFLYLFISLPFLRFYAIMPTKRTKEKYAHEIF